MIKSMTQAGSRKVTVTLVLALSFLAVGFVLAMAVILKGVPEQLSGVAAVMGTLGGGLAGLAGFFNWGNRAEHTSRPKE